MKSPFYRVQVAETGEDLTARISSFSFEDSSEKDDKLEFTIAMRNIFEYDSDWFTKGTLLNFTFGYIGGLQSGKRVAKIANLYPEIGKQLTAKVVAMDLGQFAKKNFASTLWKDKTLSEIASEIGGKYGLDLEIEKTSKKYELLPQGQKSDFDFLKNIALRENLDFRVSGDKMILEEQDLGRPSVRTYTYGEAPFIRFSPRHEETKNDTSSQVVSTTSVNPTNNQVQKSEATIDDEGKQKLGEYVIQYDADGNKKRVPKSKKEAETKEGKTVMPKSDDKSENDKTVNRVQERKALASITGTLIIEGDPIIKANEIITIANVPNKYQGNWLIKTVKHSPSSSGYQTTLELAKNATKKPVGNQTPERATDKKQEVNDTAGSAQNTASTQAVRKFDANGKPV